MRIAITTVQSPFVFGGAEFHARNLKAALTKAGHETEIVTIPLIEYPYHMLENSIMAARLLDMENAPVGRVDLCIGLKFPAYCMPHPNKVIWALHQYRVAYDLYDTVHSGMKATPEGQHARRAIYNADEKYLREAKRLYANSQNVANRMLRYNGIKATPLYHPCPDMDKFYCGECGDYILMPSRINGMKRQCLALEALSRTKSNIKIYFVGKADTEYDEKQFQGKIRELGLQNRVRCFGFVTQEEKFKLYANARAVLFIPVDEDYGYITLEAMAASKAVITATDSGGPLELVEDELTGEIVEPTAQELARAMDYIAASRYAAKEMGARGKKHLDDMGISWDNVVKELTKA